MTNHPNRKRAPVDLAGALRADMAATGETRENYAARRGIPVKTLNNWLDKPASSTMARVLAEEIAARLG